MTPERAEALLRAVIISLEGWASELRELEKCCPAKVVHLRAAIEQARLSLTDILKHDAGPE